MAGNKQLAVFVFTLAVFAAVRLSPADAGQLCGVNLNDLIGQCQQYVKILGPKVDPSAACCDVIKKIDIQCLCKSLPPGIELVVSVQKAVYVADKCGNPVQKGTKCGNITVPPLA